MLTKIIRYEGRFEPWFLPPSSQSTCRAAVRSRCLPDGRDAGKSLTHYAPRITCITVLPGLPYGVLRITFMPCSAPPVAAHFSEGGPCCVAGQMLSVRTTGRRRGSKGGPEQQQHRSRRAVSF